MIGWNMESLLYTGRIFPLPFHALISYRETQYSDRLKRVKSILNMACMVNHQ
jgi:hypothetical protein